MKPFLVRSNNQCNTNGFFRECFKIANVIPLYKKCDKTDPQNYRPISLLSSLSKTFEKINQKRVMKACQTNKLLNPIQNGFRNQLSCTGAMGLITDNFIRDVIDRQLTGQACFINLQKAFDTIDHKILLC